MIAVLVGILNDYLRAAETQVYDDPEGYSVLSLFLDRYSKDWRNSVVRIISLTASEKEMSPGRLKRCLKVPDEFQEAAQDFNGKAKTRLALAKRFEMKTAYELLEKPRAGGVYYVSAVGFDKNKTHAIAYIDYFCGALCGAGSFLLLEKGPRGWEEAKGISKCSWMR